MKQIFIISGGDNFKTKNYFYKALENYPCKPLEKTKKRRTRIVEKLIKTHQTIIPEMPNKFNADYKAWKIRFERHFSILNNSEITLIGLSLGGIFLVKYLSENVFPKRIKQIHLVAAVIQEEESDKKYGYTLGNFKLNFNKLKNIASQVENIFIYHSKDDTSVPFSHAEKYMKYFPSAKLISFEDRGHFNQEDFPELLKNIQSI